MTGAGGQGVVFLNPDSGGDREPTDQAVTEAMESCGLAVETLDDPADMPDRARVALEAGRSPIGVAGGDGTIRCVAEVLAGTGVPMVVVPAGTRNHFARELGLETLDHTVAAVRAGHVRRVSVGQVNDRTFVNNASIGMYPDMVRRRERQESRRSKALAGVYAAADVLRQGRPVEVCVDGTDLQAWLVFVGNGRYGDGFIDLVDRDSLESDVLDVRVVRADRRLARARVAAALLAGRLRSSPLIVTREAAELPLGVEGRRIDVALDGEVMTLEAPLTCCVRPGALSVVAPPEPVG